MRVRVLHAKLYAYALPGSTARQLFISSTLLDSSWTARQLLDRPRQTSTKLDAPAHGVSLNRLDKARQGSTGKASTAPRQCLDGASTARQLDSQGSTRGTPDTARRTGPAQVLGGSDWGATHTGRVSGTLFSFFLGVFSCGMYGGPGTGGGRSYPGYHRRKGVPGCAAPRISSAQARPGVWLSHRSGAGSGPGWEYIVPQDSRSGNWLPLRTFRNTVPDRAVQMFGGQT